MGHMTIDRSDAVRLARNYLARDYPPLTPHGMKVLAEAVMAMDAYVSTVKEHDEADAEYIGLLERRVGERDVTIHNLTAAINAMNVSRAPGSA